MQRLERLQRIPTILRFSLKLYVLHESCGFREAAPLIKLSQLINSDRRGEAQGIASNVRNRHEAIAKIERDMVTLAQLFQDLEAAVVQQEAPVAQIEEERPRSHTECGTRQHRARRRSEEGTRCPQKEVVVLRHRWYVSCHCLAASSIC